jgi:hypothetical protein
MPLQPGWLWPRVEAGRQVFVDLAQTVKARCPAVAQPASVSLRATVGRQACLVQMVKVKQLLEISPVLPLRPVAPDRVCLLDLAKLPAHLWPEPFAPRRLLAVGFRLRERQRQSAEQHSWGFQS